MVRVWITNTRKVCAEQRTGVVAIFAAPLNAGCSSESNLSKPNRIVRVRSASSRPATSLFSTPAR